MGFLHTTAPVPDPTGLGQCFSNEEHPFESPRHMRLGRAL
jgi:hypothetical protein